MALLIGNFCILPSVFLWQLFSVFGILGIVAIAVYGSGVVIWVSGCGILGRTGGSCGGKFLGGCRWWSGLYRTEDMAQGSDCVFPVGNLRGTVP